MTSKQNDLRLAARRSFTHIRNRLRGLHHPRDGAVPKSLRVCTSDACRICGPAASRPLRIIYLLPYAKWAVGGIKVSYKETGIITGMGVPSFVFHPTRPGALNNWFPHAARSLKVGHFDPRTDFLVFPEIWAAQAATFCIPAGIRYAVFAQNGYAANFSQGFSFDVVEEGYRHADLVLSISDDTSQILSLLYPFVGADRLVRMQCGVPPVFGPGAKEKLITYMPRKLRPHSTLLATCLKHALPPGWRLQPIHELDEHGVVELLSRSSIFLSFSDMEGYGLPPVEAALSGNIVVGYTGQGGREYFRPPVFREVIHGDFLQYAAEVRTAIADVEAGIPDSPRFKEQIAELARIHSDANEQAHVATFVARVRTLMQAPKPAVP